MTDRPTEDEIVEIGARTIYGRRGGVFVERLMEMRAVLTALHAAGMVVVPVEPTEAMIEAGWNAATSPDHAQFIASAYRAMIRAATGGEE